MLYRGSEELELAPKAVATLLALVERRGEIVSKDELLQTVWPDTIVEESNLFLYLSVLRKTLGTHPSGKPWLQTLAPTWLPVQRGSAKRSRRLEASGRREACSGRLEDRTILVRHRSSSDSGGDVRMVDCTAQAPRPEPE